MKKNTLAFVDHVFHKKTKSFDFLKSILSHKFEIELIYFDSEKSIEFDRLVTDAEYVLLAQLDYLAPLYIQAGKKVIIVPMFDGSGGMPDEHWSAGRQASYINFSRTMHVRAVDNGCRSIYVKYYPDPKDISTVTDFDSIRVFFWNRRPDSDLNIKRISELLKGVASRLHVHTPSDIHIDAEVDFDCNDLFEVTKSNWFEKNEDYIDKVSECNLYVAPRLAEGIGHSFIEAMAKGMIVVAYDLPTHNEYISNGINGILFNESVGDIQFTKAIAREIGLQARRTVEIGFQQWSRDRIKIPEFILETKKSCTPNGIGFERDVQNMVRSYLEGVPNYLSFLAKEILIVKMLADWRDKIENAVLKSESIKSVSSCLERIFNSSKSYHFGCGDGRELLTTGWSDAELTHHWSIKKKACLKLSEKPLSTNVDYVLICIRSLHSKNVTIVFNDNIVGDFNIDHRFTELRIPVGHSITANTLLEIHCDVLDPAPNPDTRLLGICLKHIHLVYDVLKHVEINEEVPSR